MERGIILLDGVPDCPESCFLATGSMGEYECEYLSAQHGVRVRCILTNEKDSDSSGCEDDIQCPVKPASEVIANLKNM